MVAVTAGAAHSWIQPVKVGLRPQEAAPSGAAPAGSQPPAPNLGAAAPSVLGQFISLAQAKALFETGSVFLDARTQEQFDEGHILGAYHLSTVELESGGASDILSLLSRDSDYVIYCDGGECEASENLAQRLEDAFPRYHIMKEGFPAWQKAGYDVELPEGGAR